jgi:acetyl esterase/lipase
MASGCAQESLLSPLNWGVGDDRTAATSNIAYGESARQRLDVYRPRGAQHAPVVLFWHGGSWQRGGKDYYAFVGESLTRRGFVAVLPDYRLAPDHPFPDFLEDAASALRWTRDHAAAFGGDPDRIYLSGHSAGGHIALIVALDPQYLRAVGMAPREIAGVMSLAGPTGLENLRGSGLTGVFPQAIPDRAFSPIALAADHGSTAPPILLMTGLDDGVVPASNTGKLADAIRAGGGDVTAKFFPDVGHVGILLGFSGLFEGRTRAVEDMARFAGL